MVRKDFVKIIHRKNVPSKRPSALPPASRPPGNHSTRRGYLGGPDRPDPIRLRNWIAAEIRTREEVLYHPEAVYFSPVVLVGLGCYINFHHLYPKPVA